jgi:hypothetical protein
MLFIVVINHFSVKGGSGTESQLGLKWVRIAEVPL